MSLALCKTRTIIFPSLFQKHARLEWVWFISQPLLYLNTRPYIFLQPYKMVAILLPLVELFLLRMKSTENSTCHMVNGIYKWVLPSLPSFFSSTLLISPKISSWLYNPFGMITVQAIDLLSVSKELRSFQTQMSKPHAAPSPYRG